ncbi:MAG TPA: DHA2 family efflux MFS transporter permease subunit [Steroidobacteraceae bacterium]|nr:DHA2 family efflux MFS transporter permease subunit [Steroidobacteraceae bacterium]
MSANAEAVSSGWSPERSAAGEHSPWAIASVISISAFMEVLDTAIANVSLRHIAGALSSSYDEATWVLTSYLVANAVVIPISGWLSDTIGRKRYYMMSVALFTLASAFCGMAPSLALLIGARILQGIAGGGLQPVTQAMLIDTFPPERRGQAMAVFGVTLILAPAIGPLLGGLITDNFSWHWIFLINVPIGVLSLFLVQAFVNEPPKLQQERAERLRTGLGFDSFGFLLIAAGLGALEITMDRGEREDWFSSTFIVASAIIAVVALLAFVVREVMCAEPMLDLRGLYRNRNFAIGTGLILLTGVILYGTTQFIPQLLQEVMGYTASQAGLALTAGGIATLIAMPIAGFLADKIQARYLIAGALLVEALALWHMTHLSTDMAFRDAAWARVWQALPIPFLFIPLTNAAYVGMPQNRSNQASALLNVARNIGGSVGISMVQTFIAHRQQFHQARHVEALHPLGANYNAGIEHITQTLAEQGQAIVDATQMATGALYQAVLKQSAMQAYIDCFWVLMVFVLVVFPVVFWLRSTPRNSKSSGHS